MVSGWNTHEKLACSYYIENDKAFTLKNDGKTSFFTTTGSSYQRITNSWKNKNDLFVGRVEMDVSLPFFLGEELYNVMLKYDDVVFSFQFDKQKFPDFGLTYNWVKQNIF